LTLEVGTYKWHVTHRLVMMHVYEVSRNSQGKRHILPLIFIIDLDLAGRNL